MKVTLWNVAHLNLGICKRIVFLNFFHSLQQVGSNKTVHMKTRLSFFLLLIIVSSVNGQTLSLKLGPSFSKLTSKATPGSCVVTHENTIIGFNAIASVGYLNFKYFNFNSGIGIIQGGGKEEIATYISPYQKDNISVKLNFLTINTSIKLKIPIKEIFEPYINVGPRVDYLLSYSHASDLFNTNPDLNKILYGALVGGGIIFKVKKIQLGLACDYYLNLNKIIDHQEHDETVSVSTFTVNAIIGYEF